MAMTAKKRMEITMRHGQADRVPATPDMSNMIPARLTGKPFWDIYLYQDPPLWLAYINAVKHFGFDGFLDSMTIYDVNPFADNPEHQGWQQAIVEKTSERLIVRQYKTDPATGGIIWRAGCEIFPVADPPSWKMDVAELGLPAIPTTWEPVTGVKSWPTGPELYGLAHEMMGDSGVIGVWGGRSCLIGSVEGIYSYYDDPEGMRRYARQVTEMWHDALSMVFKMNPRPGFVSTGASGSLIYQTEAMFRELALPMVQDVTKRCRAEGIPSQIHSCGPEALLVRICAEETDLDVIDPLEIPPMGDVDLAEIKRLYGHRLVLKGNLHTTTVMLRGTESEVREASRQAIRAAGAGGSFILSTGDQCGRDTPDANIHAMIEATKIYGQYN